MTTKVFGVIVSALLASILIAPAAFAEGGGGEDCLCVDPVPTGPKGNNGWGNGSDADANGNGGTNKGSFTGGTVGSKSINGYGTGPGPGPTKFSER